MALCTFIISLPCTGTLSNAILGSAGSAGSAGSRSCDDKALLLLLLLS